MTNAQPTTAETLPHALPECPNARLALFAMRRMGAHGLADAAVAHAFVNGFGLAFRRPLLLMRALMHEMASTATQTVAIAPCCCPRLTVSEAAFVSVLAHAENRPDHARLLLADLLAVQRADAVLTTAAALTAAFADAGRPISV